VTSNFVISYSKLLSKAFNKTMAFGPFKHLYFILFIKTGGSLGMHQRILDKKKDQRLIRYPIM